MQSIEKNRALIETPTSTIIGAIVVGPALLVASGIERTHNLLPEPFDAMDHITNTAGSFLWGINAALYGGRAYVRRVERLHSDITSGEVRCAMIAAAAALSTVINTVAETKLGVSLHLAKPKGLDQVDFMYGVLSSVAAAVTPRILQIPDRR